MHITILTLFPDMVAPFMDHSIVKKAQEKDAVDITIKNLRMYAVDTYGSVDDRPYGGGAGMILRIEPLVQALEDIHTKGKTNTKVLLTSARGTPYTQDKARELAALDSITIIAGHYEGYDERILPFVDEEISLGDFILTGGEIVAAAITDSVVRLLPGVLKKEDAIKAESFFRVPIQKLIAAVGETDILKKMKKEGKTHVTLLEYPHYTRPEEFRGMRVPSVLLSGNHKKIEQWRLQQAYEETIRRRAEFL